MDLLARALNGLSFIERKDIMAKHSDGLGLDPKTAALIDRGWDGPDDDPDGEVVSVHGDPVAGIPGAVVQHGWDLSVKGATVRSLDEMHEWLRINSVSVDEFKTYSSYLSNVDREGWEWLRDL